MTDDEYAIIKRHPEIGEQIIQPLTFRTQIFIKYHHERYDGPAITGWTRRSPREAMILSIADSFDADNRPTVPANFSFEQPFRNCADIGRQFDPNPMTLVQFLRETGKSVTGFPPDEILNCGCSPQNLSLCCGSRIPAFNLDMGIGSAERSISTHSV